MEEVQNNPPASNNSPGIQGIYLEENNRVLVVNPGSKVLEFDLNTGNVMKEIPFSNYFSSIQFTKEKDKILFFSSGNSSISTLFLDPAWEKPAVIEPSTNYVQFGEGDEAKFRVNVKNPYEFEQRATAYVWMYAPDGTMLFLNGMGVTLDAAGIPLILPANTDVTGDILSFTMPAGVPEGFYNFNAVFINDKGDGDLLGVEFLCERLSWQANACPTSREFLCEGLIFLPLITRIFANKYYQNHACGGIFDHRFSQISGFTQI